MVEVFADHGHSITVNTLDRWRMKKNYCRAFRPRLEFEKNRFTGRVRYLRDDVLKFIEQHYG